MDSKKQLKKLSSIINILQIVNYLSIEYLSYGEKEVNKDNIINRGIVYKLFCSNMSNLIDAVAKSSYLFEDFKNEYISFQEKINREYKISNPKYYEKKYDGITLYKLLKEMRNEINHFDKDVNDQITMFEIEVKFEDVEELRKTTEYLINKKAERIGKEKISKIVLSRPKIMYEKDRISGAILNLENNVKDKVMDSKYKEELLSIVSISKNIFSHNLLIGLINDEPESIEKFNLKYDELKKISNRYEKEINEKGTKEDIEKYNKMKCILKNFELENQNVIFNKYKSNIDVFLRKINELYDTSNSEK